ncbi:MAG: hypothetical protein ACJA0Q_001177 [Saprospiraceae bacterium]|jgi:hypothetical protein
MSLDDFNMKGTLNAPEKHKAIPRSAAWLSGEGAGSWFYIEQELLDFNITRFSPNGTEECKGLFKTKQQFDLTQNFELTYLSHCAEVNVIQNKIKIKLTLHQNQK